MRSPGEFDGKKVGAAGDAKPLTWDGNPVYRSSEKIGFRGLRRRAWEGQVEAMRALEWHIRRRLEKGCRVNTVAKRLGISKREVQIVYDTMRREQQDLRPRLVRRNG